MHTLYRSPVAFYECLISHDCNFSVLTPPKKIFCSTPCRHKKNTTFVSISRINLLCLKWSTDRLVIVVKGLLRLPNLLKLTKQKSISLPRDCLTIFKIFSSKTSKTNSVLNKNKSSILHYLMTLTVMYPEIFWGYCSHQQVWEQKPPET